MTATTEQSEFALIRDFLTGLGAERKDVRLDVGDDCAITKVPANQELAFSIDTLVSGVHFFPDCNPEYIGHKALAVGLSDLAAIGAEPAWATLALTLPEPDQTWLEKFARGLNRLATAHKLRLVGGDLTRGPLTISIQVMGFLEAGSGLLRSGGQPKDLLMVSGCLGDAGLALRQLLKRTKTGDLPEPDPMLRARLEQPTPRVQLGIGLRGIANAAIDISDGLLADLRHLTNLSHCGAEIHLKALPLSGAVSATVANSHDWSLPLCSGDDYELCFSVPPANLEAALNLGDRTKCQLTVIGQLTPNPGIRLLMPDGRTWSPKAPGKSQIPVTGGYNHFSSQNVPI